MCINYCNMGVAHFVIPVHHSSFTFILGKRIRTVVCPAVIRTTQTYTWKTFQLQIKCMASSFRSGNFSSDIGTTSPSLLQYFETDKYCLVGLHRYNYSYNFKTWYTVPKKHHKYYLRYSFSPWTPIFLRDTQPTTNDTFTFLGNLYYSAILTSWQG